MLKGTLFAALAIAALSVADVAFANDLLPGSSAKSETTGDRTYDTPVVTEISEIEKSDAKRVAIEKQNVTNLENYQAAVNQLKNYASSTELEPDDVSDVLDIYDDMITSLDAVLARENQVRTLFSKQLALVLDMIDAAKEELLSGGSSPASSNDETRSVVESELNEAAAILQRKDLSAEEREYWKGLFIASYQTLEMLDVTTDRLSSAERQTRGKQVRLLESLHARVLAQYRDRLVGYRAIERTRDHYALSTATLAKIKDVKTMMLKIAQLEADSPQGVAFDHVARVNDSVQLMTLIVDGLFPKGAKPVAKHGRSNSKWDQIIRDVATAADKRKQASVPASKPAAPRK